MANKKPTIPTPGDNDPLMEQKTMEELKKVSDNDLDGVIEQIKAEYLSPQILKLGLTSRLERVHINGVRYYFVIDKNQIPVFFKGTTQVVSLTMPAKSKKDHLLEWYVNHFESMKLAREYVRTKAQYGTFMHSIFAIYYRDGGITKENLNAYLTDFMVREKISMDYFDFWSQDVMSDLLSFEAFMVAHEVIPYCFEIPFYHPMGFATQIDLPCEMTVWEYGDHGEKYKSSSSRHGYKKGDPKITKGPKRIRAIINFKSKRDGVFHDDNELQLLLERKIWNYWMAEHGLGIERIFNWSPKNWVKSDGTGTPGFNLVEKTHTKEADCLEHFLAIAQKKGLIQPKKAWVNFESMTRGKQTNYQVHNLESFVTWKKNLKPLINEA